MKCLRGVSKKGRHLFKFARVGPTANRSPLRCNFTKIFILKSAIIFLFCLLLFRLTVVSLTNEYEKIEFNVEGYPSNEFIEKVIDVSPDQVTLVPDPPDALTSSFGWDCEKNKDFLMEVIKRLKDNNIRVSIFINPSTKTLSNLENIKPDRVELYTYDYAKNYQIDKILAVAPYNEVTKYLEKEFPNIELNAGHDLNLDNLDFILKNIPRIKEVSIGHALVCDAIDFGLKETVNKYKQITQR